MDHAFMRWLAVLGIVSCLVVWGYVLVNKNLPPRPTTVIKEQESSSSVSPPSSEEVPVDESPRSNLSVIDDSPKRVLKCTSFGKVIIDGSQTLNVRNAVRSNAITFVNGLKKHQLVSLSETNTGNARSILFEVSVWYWSEQ